jgi:hypothetical protein
MRSLAAKCITDGVIGEFHDHRLCYAFKMGGADAAKPHPGADVNRGPVEPMHESPERTFLSRGKGNSSVGTRVWNSLRPQAVDDEVAKKQFRH